MMDETRHISSLFDEELIDLNNDVARLGALAESQLGQVMEAVRAHDKSNLEIIVQKDDELDAIEAGLNEKAITMIALRAPLAEDLRHVIVALKVATILERTGDYAKNIAKRMLKIDDKDLLNGTKALGTMGNIVQEMLNNVLDAYMEKNVDKAMQVWERDIDVDELHTSVFREMLEKMENNSISVESGSHLLFITKNLERIGDYATGMAEQVYFLVNGEMLSDERPKIDISAQ
ncbi:MAG: phosphate signaling complex protein PhoU [Parvibaculales bacterium]